MKKILTTAMMTSISEVMETMFYTPVEFGDELTLSKSDLGKAKTDMACQLDFSGDCSGYLKLLAPKDLLEEITENFMGESRENLENEHLSGTLTEMLNMICGNALSKVESKVPYELGIPKLINTADIDGSELFTIVNTTQSDMAIQISVD